MILQVRISSIGKTIRTENKMNFNRFRLTRIFGGFIGIKTKVINIPKVPVFELIVRPTNKLKRKNK